MTVLAHRHRRTIYEKLSPIVGDEETEAMLAHFPATPGEEPVNRNDLRADLADLRAELVKWTVGSLVGGLSIGMGVAAAVGAMFGS